MPSKKRSQPHKDKQSTSEVNRKADLFISYNQQALAELLTFIDFADEKLTIAFVEVNFAKDRDSLIDTLKNHPQCQDIQFAIFNFANPNLRFLRDAIVEELAKVTIEIDKKLVLMIIGLEHSIGMSGEYPPVLQDLNFVRDDFTTSVPHPLLIYLPDYALTRLAKYAPDFWAWRTGVFHFKTADSTKNEAINKTLESERILGSLALPEKQERIDLLERLLMEYHPSTHQQAAADIRTRVVILRELGIAYRSQGEYPKARHNLEAALKLPNANQDLESIKASVLYGLGRSENDQGEVDIAVLNYMRYTLRLLTLGYQASILL